MDPNFKEWCVKKAEQDLQKTVARQTFLRILKFEPERIQVFIAENAMGWGMACAVETREVTVQNFKDDPSEILKAFQKHFAPELAKITAE